MRIRGARILDRPVVFSDVRSGTLQPGLVNLDGPDCYVVGASPSRYEVRPGVPLIIT